MLVPAAPKRRRLLHSGALSPNRLTKADIPRGRADPDLVRTRRHLPAALPDSKHPVRQRKGYFRAFSRHQLHTLKSAELLQRAMHAVLRHAEIHLDDLRPLHSSGISDAEVHLISIDRQVLIDKPCVGQAISERELHLHAGLIIIPISCIDSLAVLRIRQPARIIPIARNITLPNRPRLRQLPRGILPAAQQIRRCLPALLAGKSEIQHTLHLVKPGQQHDAAAHQHHNRILIDRSCSPDHAVLPLGQRKCLPVKALGFAGIRKSGENNHLVRPCCLAVQVLQALLCHTAILPAARDIPAILHDICRLHKLRRLNMTASGALITHFGRHRADQQHLLPFPQRKHSVLILQ